MPRHFSSKTNVQSMMRTNMQESRIRIQAKRLFILYTGNQRSTAHNEDPVVVKVQPLSVERRTIGAAEDEDEGEADPGPAMAMRPPFGRLVAMPSSGSFVGPACAIYAICGVLRGSRKAVKGIE